MCTSLLDTCTHIKFEQNKYHRVKFRQIKSEETLKFYLNKGVKFYTYTENVTYEEVPKNEELNVNYDYYIKIPNYTYINVNGEEQYKNETLYKKEQTLTKASETDILDTSKEKFVYETVITYRIKQENDQGKDLYIKEGENTFIKYEGTPVEGTIYYVEDSSTKLISIGNVVTNRDEYGDIYYYTDGSVYKEASEAETEDYWKNPASYTMYRLETTYDYRKATQEETINYPESSIILYKSDAYEWVDPSRISELEDETVVFVVMNS